MNEIKPIQTYFIGYKFRSRLEARWAVFFESLGIKWEYEPEGFDLGNGLKYLPDFKIKNVKFIHANGCSHDRTYDIYIEVKGDMNVEDIKKIDRFAECGKKIYVVGNIPRGDTIWNLTDDANTQSCDFIEKYGYFGTNKYHIPPFDFVGLDDDCYFAFPGIDKKGYFALFGCDGDYLTFIDEEKTIQSYNNARQARFEHGESPKL